MPCSTVDYRRSSSTMTSTAVRSRLLDSDVSGINKYGSDSSGSGATTYGTRRPSTTTTTTSDYKNSSWLTRSCLSRPGSLTEDRVQTRDTSSATRISRSRTSSYSSSTDSALGHSASKPFSSKKSYISSDLAAFLDSYSPDHYIPRINKTSSDSVSSLAGRPPQTTIPSRVRAVRGKDTTSEVISSILVNGTDRSDKTSRVHGSQPPPSEDRADVESLDSAGSISPMARASSLQKSTANNGLNGLRNLGNTCFLNSVVQCLSNTKILKDYLVNREYVSEIRSGENRGALIKSFADVVIELWSDESKFVNPAAFKAQIQRFAPRFMGYNQQDAQEFLRYLLEGIHEEINRVAVKAKNLPEIDDSLSDSAKAAKAWEQYLRIDDSRIVDLFVGQLKSTLQCTTCRHASTTFEAFWDLSLPLPASSSSNLRLSQCLDHFTKEEILDGHEMPTCSKCKVRRKCTKSFSIQKFPKILVLHLKRFSPSERYRKLSASVDFPLTNLDMSPYASNSSQQSRLSYNLYAVSNHSGTAYSGHYTAYCLHPGTNQWYEFNDTRVNSVSSRSIVSPEAYILFYEQAGGSTGRTTASSSSPVKTEVKLPSSPVLNSYRSRS